LVNWDGICIENTHYTSCGWAGVAFFALKGTKVPVGSACGIPASGLLPSCSEADVPGVNRAAGFTLQKKEIF